MRAFSASTVALLAAACSHGVTAQGTVAGTVIPAHTVNDTFNASYPDPSTSQLSNMLIASGLNLSDAAQSAVKVTLGYEQSNWAGSSVATDPFYTSLPSNWSSAKPGDVLKVEEYTNTSLYNLPPQTSLSRFLFVTADINGTAQPASAYVLWPYAPREFDGVDGVPVVVWAHGTSGYYGECGPSHMRDLFYQYTAPYTLALQGYAVVAPDFAGLGIDRIPSSNTSIPNQYLLSPATANDIFYSASAAKSGFPILSSSFVVFGHSQGGGAAWAAAQRQAVTPVAGYLGAIAGSPATSYVVPELGAGIAALIGPTLKAIFPSFEPSQWLTALGLKYMGLLRSIQGCQATFSELIATAPGGMAALVNATAWQNSWEYPAWQKLAATGTGLPIAGPMLVLQGLSDPAVLPNTTMKAVNETCALYGNSANSSVNATAPRIDFRLYEGATHFPTLYASQQDWLRWIDDRFSGKGAGIGCTTSKKAPPRTPMAYQQEIPYFLEFGVYSYETTL